MAAQTLAQIKQKIAELQRQAEAARAEEVAGVVARIREAIAHYDLSVKDLFGGRGKARKSPGNAVGKKAGVVRFRDADGNSWAGRGKRPNWFKAAIASGAKPEDLAV